MKSTNDYKELFNHFWKAIDTSTFIPKTSSEIDRIMNEIYLSEDPLVETNKNIESNIKKSIEQTLETVLNKDIFKIIAENPIIYLRYEKTNNLDNTKYNTLDKFWQGIIFTHNYLFMTNMEKNYENWYEKRQEAMRIALTLGGKILSKKEKKEHFSNREIWEEGRYVKDNSNSGFSFWGHRKLFSNGKSESYYHKKENFIKRIEDIKKDTGKRKIELLDIGGGFGEACEDAENLNIGIHATNLLIDPLPVKFRTDTILCSAERMPKRFKNSYDIILSNMAFRYFSYPDIVLENVIQSLNVGGVALIDAGADRPRYRTNDFAERLANQYKRIKHLHDNGIITLKVSQSVLDFIPTSENYFPSAWVEIKKLREI
jgi:SAM-dependent methyltransferase